MKLVIYNNKSGYSTVLDAFLKTAQKEFEEIYVFFPRKVRIDDYSVYKNIKFFNCTVISFLISFFESTLQIFTKDTICDLKTALRKKKFCINYVKIYFIQLFKANALFRESKKIVKKQHKEGVSLFSTWYAENAIAAAKMKKIYPEIYAASYAHSYEIDFRKNNYVGLLRDRFKERYLDKICFISKNVMEEYKLLNSCLLYTSPSPRD